MLATKRVLETFQFIHLGRNLAKTIKPTIFACREILQEFSDTLDESREGHIFAVIRNLWGLALWSGSEAQGLSILREKLLVHQTALREFLAALNSYVRHRIGAVFIDDNHHTASPGKTLTMD